MLFQPQNHHLKSKTRHRGDGSPFVSSVCRGWRHPVKHTSPGRSCSCCRNNWYAGLRSRLLNLDACQSPLWPGAAKFRLSAGDTPPLLDVLRLYVPLDWIADLWPLVCRPHQAQAAAAAAATGQSGNARQSGTTPDCALGARRPATGCASLRIKRRYTKGCLDGCPLSEWRH